MKALWLVLCRVFALFAIAASAALYVQYLSPGDAAFCGLESGCEEVRSAGYSYFYSQYLSMPLLGLVGFAAVYFLTLKRPQSKVLPAVAMLGGLFALLLLYVQASEIGAYCWLCVVVDVSAVLVAVFAWLHHKKGDAAVDPLVELAWVGLAALAVAAPPLWSKVMPGEPVPGVIRAFYVPGKINVVEFADFECPHCRRLHPILKDEIEQFPAGTVNFVRMNAPLPGHPHAEPAARAYLCAREQQKGEEMADALMAEVLDDGTQNRLAARLGLDMQSFATCMVASSTTKKLAREFSVLEAAGFYGLPTTYIGGKRFLGSVSPEAVRDALLRAERGDDAETGIPAPIYAALVIGAAGALVWFGRRARATLHHGASN